MQLSVWTYEGPPHFGAMRIANSMRGVHLMLHAPQGDTYADLLFTMIERNQTRPPVTYTTFQARDLGSSTAELVLETLRKTAERYKPEVMLVCESCTGELIQDQPGTLATTLGLPCPIIPVEMQAYSRKENWGASETFYRLVRGVLGQRPANDSPSSANTTGRSVNILGPTSLGFRCRDDIRELGDLLNQVGIHVNVVAPLGASPSDLARIPEADANICLHPEIAELTCNWLGRQFNMPVIKTAPIGVSGTAAFLTELGETLGLDLSGFVEESNSRLPWYSRSVDSTYLTGKRVFIFGDAMHACAAARVARNEFGFEVVGLGTYSREQAKMVRTLAAELGVEALITEDYLAVEQRITELQPELILGTQMERHTAKKLGIGCAVISTPAHVQDYPARYSPQVGFEGANVLFDTWVHPLMMGLEEHLLAMFRDDFEFGDNASHLGAVKSGSTPEAPLTTASAAEGSPNWDNVAEQELKKIPFFVRGKARRNTERFASEHGITTISVETLYEAKAYFSA